MLSLEKEISNIESEIKNLTNQNTKLNENKLRINKDIETKNYSKNMVKNELYDLDKKINEVKKLKIEENLLKEKINDLQEKIKNLEQEVPKNQFPTLNKMYYESMNKKKEIMDEFQKLDQKNSIIKEKVFKIIKTSNFFY